MRELTSVDCLDRCVVQIMVEILSLFFYVHVHTHAVIHPAMIKNSDMSTFIDVSPFHYTQILTGLICFVAS